MYKLGILVLTVALVTATPINLLKLREDLRSEDEAVRNNALENVVLGILEDVREIMVTGAGDIPVLDPLELDYLHIDDTLVPLPGAHLTIEDLKVSKLSTFVINTLSIGTNPGSLTSYRVLLDLDVPVLEADTGAYDLSVSAMGFTVFGTGAAKIVIVEPKVTADLTLSTRFVIIGGLGVYLSINTCEVKFFLRDIDINITGLFGDNMMADFINSFLQHLIIDAVQLFEPTITSILSDIVKDIGNQILADINVIDIIGFP